MTREQKIKKDAKALRKYAERLRKEKKVYMGEAMGAAENNRRPRAFTLGECALRVMDEVRGLARTRKLVDGTLEYMISEQKGRDTDGRTTFVYTVAYRVVGDEPAHTDEWIREEIEKTFEKMMLETDEMFPPEEAKAEDAEAGAAETAEEETGTAEATGA